MSQKIFDKLLRPFFFVLILSRGPNHIYAALLQVIFLPSFSEYTITFSCTLSYRRALIARRCYITLVTVFSLWLSLLLYDKITGFVSYFFDIWFERDSQRFSKHTGLHWICDHVYFAVYALYQSIFIARLWTFFTDSIFIFVNPYSILQFLCI